jgi:hypothetical protein
MSGATVELANALTWTVTSANPTVTNAGGRATWQLGCDAVGSQPVAVIVNDAAAYALNLSSCVPPPPPTTTTVPSATTPGSTTSTTGVIPGTTTSTLAPP